MEMQFIDSYQSLSRGQRYDNRPLPRTPEEGISPISPPPTPQPRTAKFPVTPERSNESKGDVGLRVLLIVTIICLLLHSVYLALKDSGALNAIIYKEPLKGSCSSEWERGWNSCFFLASNDKYNWFEAKHYCRRQGASLALLDTPTTHAHVTQYLHSNICKLTGSQECSFWIGLSDLAANNTFVWEKTGREYLNSSIDRPTKRPSENWKRCVALRLQDDKTWGWKVDNCDSKRHAVCDMIVSH